MTSSTIESFAPGKIILLGEHSVVSGEPALVGAISRGVRVVAEKSPTFSLALSEELNGDGRRLIERAIDVAARAVGRPSLRFRIESQLPISMGLGSSAATAVACARALLEASGLTPTVARILELAMRMEKVFHGTPSGVDHTCSAYNRLLLFSRTEEPTSPSVKLLEPAIRVHLVVALLGKRGLTRAALRRLKTKGPRLLGRYNHLYRAMGEITREGTASLERGDMRALGRAMNENHRLLQELQVSSPVLDSAVARFRELGAHGAKLTGAGGSGGAVIGLFDEPTLAVNALQREGYTCFSEQLGASA